MNETEPREKKKGSKKKIRKKWLVTAIVCAVVLIAAVIIIAVYAVRMNRAKNAYEELAETAYTTTQETTTQEETTKEEVVIPIDFEALWEENEDIYAWIYIEDTVVDYPVVQSSVEDNYYLRRGIDGEYLTAGMLYTQASYNGTDFTDNVTIIYGHNMRDNTMFGTITDYFDEEYLEEHSEIIIYTPEHILTYEVVFIVTYNNHLIPYYFDIDTQEGYQSFLDSLSTDTYSPSLFTEDYEPSTEDRLLILSTCPDSFDETYRVLLGAVLVDDRY